jgi:hypothetical protein
MQLLTTLRRALCMAMLITVCTSSPAWAQSARERITQKEAVPLAYMITANARTISKAISERPSAPIEPEVSQVGEAAAPPTPELVVMTGRIASLEAEVAGLRQNQAPKFEEEESSSSSETAGAVFGLAALGLLGGALAVGDNKDARPVSMATGLVAGSMGGGLVATGIKLKEPSIVVSGALVTAAGVLLPFFVFRDLSPQG